MGAEDRDAVEEMAAFFNARAAGYSEYIRRNNTYPDAAFVQFYQALSSPIESTEEPFHILDLGCGLGSELEALFQNVPNALVTGIDVAENMLELLRQRYAAYASQLTLVAGSYLTMPFERQAYDYIISAVSLHHILHDTKRELYARIHAALRPGGKYIEGDVVAPADMESHFLGAYYEKVATVPPAPDGHYHIDIPFSLATQKSLLLAAGFKDFKLIWEREGAEVCSIAVYVVTA